MDKMKDDFKEYFEANSGRFDSREANEHAIWPGVERALQNKKDTRSFIIWRAAAVLLALVAVAQLTYIITSRSKASPVQLALVSEASGAFQSLEAAYRQELLQLEERLTKKEIDRAEYATFFDEIEYIQNLEREFKEEIPITSDREKIAGILIDTYEKKIQLLERLLQQVERDEKIKNDMNEGMMPMKKNHKSLEI